MVTQITKVFLDSVEAIFGGIGTGLVTVFNTVIWDPTLNDNTGGLTNLAIWMLIFMGLSFALTIFYGLFRKVA